MQETNSTGKTIYRPIPFLLSVFSITWLCAFLMTITDYNTHPLLFTVLDFLENASPLICAFVLLKKTAFPDALSVSLFYGKSRTSCFLSDRPVSICGTVFQLLLFPPAGNGLHDTGLSFHLYRAASPGWRTGGGGLARLPAALFCQTVAYSAIRCSNQPDLGILASALFYHSRKPAYGTEFPFLHPDRHRNRLHTHRHLPVDKKCPPVYAFPQLAEHTCYDPPG